MEYPKIAVIVTTYSPEQKAYLDLCIESIYNMDYPADKLSVTIVGKRGYLPGYSDKRKRCVTVHPDQEEFSNPVGINCGFEWAARDPDVKHFLYLNDDVICTRDMLRNMVDVVGDNNWIMHAISSCDNGRAFLLNFPIWNSQQYRLADIEGAEKAMMNAKSFYPVGFILQPFLCLFAALIPRHVWEKVGPWDENYQTGQDDIDYSYMATRQGVALGFLTNAVCYHASGVSADSTMTLDKRKQSARYFKKKWNMVPPFVSEEFLKD